MGFDQYDPVPRGRPREGARDVLPQHLGRHGLRRRAGGRPKGQPRFTRGGDQGLQREPNEAEEANLGDSEDDSREERLRLRQGPRGCEAERVVDLAGQLKAAIRSIPDYPKKGIVFRDLTTLWKDGKLMRKTTDHFYERYKGRRVEKILGVEARGFIVGAPLADRLSIGFVPARKVGKLPADKVTME